MGESTYSIIRKSMSNALRCSLGCRPPLTTASAADTDSHSSPVVGHAAPEAGKDRDSLSKAVVLQAVTHYAVDSVTLGARGNISGGNTRLYRLWLGKKDSQELWRGVSALAVFNMQPTHIDRNTLRGCKNNTPSAFARGGGEENGVRNFDRESTAFVVEDVHSFLECAHGHHNRIYM